MSEKIKTSPNGPFIIKGIRQLTEANGNNYPLKDKVNALCRCGYSRSKPFCDGQHAKHNWTDQKEEGRQPRRSDDYKGKEITIHDDRGICSHAGYCTDGLPKVFRMNTEPWIDPDGERVEKIIETIKKCPSGALSYSIDGVKYDKFSEQPEIQITEDGPYYVKGNIALEDEDSPESEEHYALCRCGNSKNKPFCDGQHWYTKFTDEGKAHEIAEIKDPNKARIQQLAKTGESENSAMGTLKDFPRLDTDRKSVV